MSSNTIEPGKAASDAFPSGHDQRRRLVILLTALAIIAVVAVALYAISLIVGAVILLLLSALLAYIITPLVHVLQRRLSPSLAIVVAYVLAAGFLAIGMFIVTTSLIQQTSSLVQYIQFLLSPAGERQTQAVVDFLGRFGITSEQIALFKSQLFAQVQGVLAGLLPLLSGLFSNVINLIVAITLSVYFVIDGPRMLRWLSLKTPLSQRSSINFLLHSLDQSLGGYFRGSLLIALIGSLATGIGLALLHVQYAALLGALFFLLYFIPVLGGYIMEALCILAALPQGWVITLSVFVYITILQAIVIGQILSPRIFSKTVGVHPIVALFALFAGSELFGLLGGILSIPVAGVLQQIIAALWHRWKKQHPAQFPGDEQASSGTLQTEEH